MLICKYITNRDRVSWGVVLIVVSLYGCVCYALSLYRGGYIGNSITRTQAQDAYNEQGMGGRKLPPYIPDCTPSPDATLLGRWLHRLGTSIPTHYKFVQ